MDAIFSIESVPHPNPLTWITQPSPYYHHHHQQATPVHNLHRTSFPILQPIQSYRITPFPDLSWRFDEMNNFFDKQFSSAFPPAIIPSSLSDEVICF